MREYHAITWTSISKITCLIFCLLIMQLYVHYSLWNRLYISCYLELWRSWSLICDPSWKSMFDGKNSLSPFLLFQKTSLLWHYRVSNGKTNIREKLTRKIKNTYALCEKSNTNLHCSQKQLNSHRQIFKFPKLYCSSRLGSVGSIEATIPSSLCSGPLGVLSNEDTLGENQNDEALGALHGTLQDLQNSPEDIQGSHNQQLHNSGQNQVVSEFGASFWVDDMAGFPLPPLDLDPLPPGLFSPCSATYK